jgi:hypothetical protein
MKKKLKKIMKKQRQLNLEELNTDKDVFKRVVTDPILLGEDDTVKQGIINLNTYILKTAADFVGFKDRYSDFKIIAVSAWDHDETHIRHLSCSSDFRVKTSVAPHWKMEGQNNHQRCKYHQGEKWEPGNVSPVAGADDKCWTDSSVDSVLSYAIDVVLHYYLGKAPCNVGAGVPFRGQNPPKTKADIRYAVSAAAGLLYGLDSFIYSVVDIKGDSSFNHEGAVVIMSLNSDGSEYNVEYKGDAYITEPQLVIRAEGLDHLSENIYI